MREPGLKHHATLQFYYPIHDVEYDVVQHKVDQILSNGLNKIVPKLAENVISVHIFDPKKYKRIFGFHPYVFETAPDRYSERLPSKTPVQNLYCVGDSVLPNRPSVPQAMESGLLCAKMIVKGKE